MGTDTSATTVARPAAGRAEAAAELSTKGVLRLVLVGSFLVALVLSAGGTYLLLHERAVKRIAAEAGRLLSIATAVRSYTTDEITPFLSNDNTFRPVTVPAFAAHAVFRRVQSSFPGYSYREPSFKPTNPEDLPTPFEVTLLNRFRAEPALKELTGVRQDLTHRSVYYLARPIVAQEECLTCHGVPKQAPAAMVAKYGPHNGFDWKPGEVIAIQSVTLPAADELRETHEIALLIAGGLLVLLLLTYFALAVSLDALLIRPIAALSRLLEAASVRDDPHLALSVSGAREVRALAASIERLRISLRKALARLEREP